MRISEAAAEWAINSLATRGDTDLFPHLPEFQLLQSNLDVVRQTTSTTDISNVSPGAARRFIVPKDDLSFRVATQLYPLDSLILTALMYEHGGGIESRRIPSADKVVFSYRFKPHDGDLYDERRWNDFWAAAYRSSRQHNFAVCTDISDFYNQIGHHTVENQLTASGFPNQAMKYYKRTYQRVTAEVSRGIPISPHTSHLVAEATLIPIDETMKTPGIPFCRYSDDIIMFADSRDEASQHLFELARILDVQQRLQQQRGKTVILPSSEFASLCRAMIEDRPINDEERKLLKIISKYTKGNPYATIWINDLDKEDLLQFTEPIVEGIFTEYLGKSHPDYIRLRWFIRRLAQVGHPAGIAYCLEHFKEMRPAISEICRYFISVSSAKQVVAWLPAGEILESTLDDEVVRVSEYATVSIVALFASVPELNHLDKVLKRFDQSQPAVRRELILAAAASGHVDWLRGLKEQFPAMDPWSRSAYIYACRLLLPDEKKFFMQYAEPRNEWERLLIAICK